MQTGPAFVLYYLRKRRVGQPRAYLQRERVLNAKKEDSPRILRLCLSIDAGVFPGIRRFRAGIRDVGCLLFMRRCAFLKGV